MGKKTTIGILSDTHSLLRPEVEEVLEGCDYILHAGDIASWDAMERIKDFAPAFFVRGNADEGWGWELPRDREVEIEGFRFYLVHNIRHKRSDLSDVDFVVYGHSHKYENRKEGEITFINPGSCGPRRFTQPVTMMLLTIAEGSIQIERIDLSPVLKRGEKLPPPREMDRLILAIIKDMNAGRTVAEIAERNRVEEDLVKEILQIYTTHPGIDTEGILNRMK